MSSLAASAGKSRRSKPLSRSSPAIAIGRRGWSRCSSSVDIGISRTRAAYRGQEEIHEIETLYLDIIAAAKRFIYFENQYFTWAKIAAAIAKRMAEPDGPEIVLVMPRTAEGWLEQQAMDAARLKLIEAIGSSDKSNRFRVYVPMTKAARTSTSTPRSRSSTTGCSGSDRPTSTIAASASTANAT